MILTDEARREFEWLNDLANLPSDVRDAVLVLLDALAKQDGHTLHSAKSSFVSL